MRSRSRVYGGRTQEERRSDRRRRLVDAALAIWEEQGWSAVTMRGVCARAALTDRYFYESFADRDALLVAAWDQVRDEGLELVAAAIIAEGTRGVRPALRAGIAAIVNEAITQPGRARIAFSDHAGSAVLEQRRRKAVQEFTGLLLDLGRPFIKPGVDADALRMSTLIGIGGFVELITAWLAGGVEVGADRLIDHATEVGMELATPYVTAAR